MARKRAICVTLAVPALLAPTWVHSDVVINEVHYDPLVKTEFVEFVELCNAGTNAVDLGGWYFSAGISYRFPVGTILGVGEYVVVGQDPVAVSDTFGVSCSGPFAGTFRNSGETVRLRDSAGIERDEVSYGLGFPWPTIGEIPEKSMQLLNPALDNALGGSWRSDSPTPGTANGVRAAIGDIPPLIRQVQHTPDEPASTNAVVITAKVTDADGVGSVVLQYQLVDPGSYIRVSDASYDTTWTDVAMNDSGSDGDAVAGDDIYSVTMGEAMHTHRRLVRYRITVEDGQANSLQVPYADDEQPNFAYFVYDGVPAWVGAKEPGVSPVTNVSADVMADQLPVYHLVANGTDVVNSQYNSGYNGTRMWGTMVYDGRVYDHIQFYNRGEYSTYRSGKNKWRFKFNRGRDFKARDIYGTRYEADWRTMNVNACASPWIPVNRGMAGMDEAVPHRLYQLIGGPSSRTHWLQFRIIDAAEEAPADQYSGDLWGLYLAIEHPDGRLLDERDLPDGSTYKIQGGAGNKKNQGPTQPLDSSDWDAFWAASAALNTVDRWRENFWLDGFYGFRAINRAVGNVDLRDSANYYMYHHPDGRWHVIPWDLDMMYIPETHWSGVIRADRCLDHASIRTEFRNRCRESLDLLFSDIDLHGGQAAQLVEELSQIVNPAGVPLTMVDVDEYMWSHHPRTASDHLGPWYVSPKTQGQRGGTWTRALPTPDHEGFQQNMIEYMYNTRPGGGFTVGDGDERGYGFGYLSQEAADSSIPDRPTITYSGPAGYPADNLQFQAGSFSDPNGAGTFGAMQWRIGEIANPSTTNFSQGEPWRYEIETQWKSAVLSDYSSTVEVSTDDLKEGRTYRARVRMMDDTGRWSHWSEPVQFVAGAAVGVPALRDTLCITEVMYDPRDGSDFEFIELRNGSDAMTVDLDGMSFTRGIDYTFGTNVSMPPGGYLLVVKANAADNFFAFRNYYGLGGEVPICGPYDGKLNNGGEAIRLKPSSGAGNLVSFTYNDSRGWPLAADGPGHSLVPTMASGQAPSAGSGQATGALDYSENWRASTYIGGSPGGADPVVANDLKLNEIAAHTDYTNAANPGYDSNDWLELYNAKTSGLSLAGWYLSDSGSDLRKWAIPATNTIAAKGWVVFDELTGFHNPLTAGFGLDKAGEQVFLSYLPGTSEDRVADAVRFEGQENGVSLGRYPDGGDYWRITALTPATTNAPAIEHVVINQVMVHPPDGTSEYLVLYNSYSTAAPLWNDVGTYRVDGGIDYMFPSNTTIAARDYVALVPFNPTNAADVSAFETAYGLSPGQTYLLGPFSGKLENDGERVALERPQAPDDDGDDIAWVIVDEVIFSGHAPWPTNIHGNGNALQRINTRTSGNDPDNWVGQPAGLVPARIFVTSPRPGSTLYMPFSDRVSAAINPEQVSGTVHEVRFFLDGALLGADDTSPYSTPLTYTHVSNVTSYTVRADLIDDGGTNRSVDIVFQARNADRVHIAEPDSGLALVAPFTQLVRATVDMDHVLGSIDNVSFYAGTNLLFADTTAPYEFLADHTDLPPTRWHDVTATVSDDVGPTTSRVVRLYSYDSVWSNATHRMTVHFPGYAGIERLSEVPALVTFRDALRGFDYAQMASPTGGDLRFADQSGTNIVYHEIETWDTNGTSAVWVRLPELVSTSTWIWAYWGDTDATLPTYATDGSVWANDYDIVLHLSDSGGSATLDSSPNGHAAGFAGFGTWAWGADGVIGDAAEVTDLWSYISLGTGIPLGTEWTLSSWFKDLDGTPRKRTLTETGGYDSPVAIPAGGNALGMYIDPGQNVPSGATLAPAGGWRHLTVVGNASGIRYFIDADEVGSVTNTFTGTLLSAGNRSTGASVERFALYLDEFRISSVARGVDWISASRLNQVSNDLFVTFGAAELQHPASEPETDSDGDGMDDDWEDEHLGGTAADPDDDADRDGMTNLEEFIAGTNPTNGLSLFDVSLVWSNGQLCVRFQTQTERYYSLESNTNILVPTSWRGVGGYTNIPGVGQSVIFTNPPEAPPQSFRGSLWRGE